MYDAAWWADEINELVSAIPRAQGEDVDQKKARVARFVGVSRATLYNILAGKPTRLVDVRGWLKLLSMVPEGKVVIRQNHLQKILQALGENLERAS